MKLPPRALWLLMATAVLNGCSRDPQGSPLGKNLVQQGKTVTWADGRLIYVQQRQANTLSGIRLEDPAPGVQRTVEAEHGVISKDSDGRTLRITLYNAVVRTGARPPTTLQEFSVICAN